MSMTADQLDERWGQWMDALEAIYLERNGRLGVPRRPAVKADVALILAQAASDPDVERYLHQEASIEAAKMVTMGFWRLIVGLRSHNAEALQKVETWTPATTLQEICRGCVDFWPD